MSKGSIITLILLLVLTLGGFLGFKEYQKFETAKEAKAEALQVSMGSTLLRENKPYVESLIDKHHDAAFKAGFKREHIFAPTEFDGQKYMEVLWEGVAASALTDNKPEIAAALPSVHVGKRGDGVPTPPS